MGVDQLEVSFVVGGKSVGNVGEGSAPAPPLSRVRRLLLLSRSVEKATNGGPSHPRAVRHDPAFEGSVFSASQRGILAIGHPGARAGANFEPIMDLDIGSNFVRRGNVVVVVPGGGDKSTQARDIELAKSLEREL
jgi:hypothetical protein